jgi:spermidine synthase
MEGGDARNGSTGTSQTKGSGVDGPAKPLPPCCVKARAAAPESEAKCHATVVSGWFSEPRSRSGNIWLGAKLRRPLDFYLPTDIL